MRDLIARRKFVVWLNVDEHGAYVELCPRCVNVVLINPEPIYFVTLTKLLRSAHTEDRARKNRVLRRANPRFATLSEMHRFIHRRLM